MRSLCLALALVPAFAFTVVAQEATTKPATVESSATTFRSSKLVGMGVKNAAGKDLGKIEDLVIDERGHVRYAALSFGGFLGFNNKYFAVPWKSIKVKRDASSDSYFVELNVTKEYLDNANGFPSDKWPDFANPEINKKIDAYWSATESKTTTTLPRP
jgi:sporulation protein YlmC with PRC-barrel domain